ncbi:MAG: hypothetical protein KJP00_12120 [Bacteroidia bacterium]|nr:hypothetical protein [Bacteroidia bacterium]
MQNKFRIILYMILVLGIVQLIGCYAEQFEPEPVIIDPVETISFSGDIIPLFSSGCTQSICHGTGAAYPDLTPSRAYNELVNGGFINTADPVSSELYLWLIGDGGRIIMPPSGRDEELIELTLGWMQQGALDN